MRVPALSGEASREAAPDGHLAARVRRLYAQLVHGRLVGVCEGVARAVALLMTRARFPRRMRASFWWRRIAKCLLPTAPV